VHHSRIDESFYVADKVFPLISDLPCHNELLVREAKGVLNEGHGTLPWAALN